MNAAFVSSEIVLVVDWVPVSIFHALQIFGFHGNEVDANFENKNYIFWLLEHIGCKYN